MINTLISYLILIFTIANTLILLTILIKTNHALEPVVAARDLLLIAKDELAAWVGRAKIVSTLTGLITNKVTEIVSSSNIVNGTMTYIKSWWS